MQKIFASLGLILATIIWGSTFAAQRDAMEVISPWSFSAIRTAVGVLALLPVIFIQDLITLKKITLWGKAVTATEKKFLLWGGIFCGLAITPAMLTQQLGLCETSAGKTGFLTALYIIIVPILGIFFKRKTSLVLWGGVILALAGSFLLCYRPGEGVSFSRGDISVIACAFLYSIHILVIDRYAPGTDCLRLSLIQFLVAALLFTLATFFIEGAWSVGAVTRSAPHWLYSGIGSCAAAFTLQMVAQKYLHPVMTSLLMSLESVFAVLAGYIFLKENLSSYELAGCALLFVAVLLAQVPGKSPGKEEGAA